MREAGPAREGAPMTRGPAGHSHTLAASPAGLGAPPAQVQSSAVHFLGRGLCVWVAVFETAPCWPAVRRLRWLLPQDFRVHTCKRPLLSDVHAHQARARQQRANGLLTLKVTRPVTGADARAVEQSHAPETVGGTARLSHGRWGSWTSCRAPSTRGRAAVPQGPAPAGNGRKPRGRGERGPSR
jgi:hypothetical protein